MAAVSSLSSFLNFSEIISKVVRASYIFAVIMDKTFA